MSLLCLVFVLGAVVQWCSVQCSDTVTATRSSLQRLAWEAVSSNIGRSGGQPRVRTNFYKVLGDIERSIEYAEANLRPVPAGVRSRSLLNLRRAIVAAAKRGNYNIGREIFAITRVIEDRSSLSRSRRRYRRGADDIIEYIREKIGDETFNQFFKIESSTSLTFVVDTTGSMQEDILQVQKIVRKLASPDEDQDGFHTFLLALFKDPEVSPPETFYDKGEFLSTLEQITVSGGGDCDEMVMSGISEGLVETEAYSPVFVFTDAGSKDIERMDDVLSNARVLFSPLFFFITPSPECQGYSDFLPYHDMADQTAGQVLSISKSEIYRLQNFVRSTGVGRSEITSGDESARTGVTKRDTGQIHVKEFYVDDTVNKLVVTVNFDSQSGSSYLLSPTADVEYPTFVSSFANMRLYEIDLPVPGTWTIKAIIDQGDKFTYKVHTVSSTNIDFTFNLLTEDSGREVVTNHAVPGEVMKLQLDVVGGDEEIVMDTSEVFLMDVSGNVISTVQTLDTRSGHSYDGQFVVPPQQFRLMLFGETSTGFPFTRTSQTTINPSYCRLETFHANLLRRKVLQPGSRGNLFFKFTHYSDTSHDFEVSFNNPDRIINTPNPLELSNVWRRRSRFIRLKYSIPRDVPDGTDYRITLLVNGGGVKCDYVYTVLIATMSG